MTRIVASEHSRRLLRDESYSATPGPKIPGGLMHAMGRHADTTSCGRQVAADSLHVWPALTFPRAYGAHCPICLEAEAATGPGGLEVLALTRHESSVDAQPS